MTRPSYVLPLVGVLLLSASGLLIWKNVGRATPAAVSNPREVKAKPRTRASSVTPDPERLKSGRTREETRDLEQINAWIAEESTTPGTTAGKLWKLAGDPERSELVRDEALAHALDLTDDESYSSLVMPLLAKRDLWSGPLGEKILNDLYNRPDSLKLQGTVALYQNSTGELHANVRELLVFELSDPEAEKLSDAELIPRANERMKAAPEEATSNVPPGP